MPDFIHMEKRADLMEQGNVPKLGPAAGHKPFPDPSSPVGGREMEQGGREAWTAEYLAPEICSGNTNLHFMVLS